MGQPGIGNPSAAERQFGEFRHSPQMCQPGVGKLPLKLQVSELGEPLELR